MYKYMRIYYIYIIVHMCFNLCTFRLDNVVELYNKIYIFYNME